MCKVMEDMRNESLKEGEKRGEQNMVLRMLQAGKYTLEEIAELSCLSLDDVRRLQIEQGV